MKLIKRVIGKIKNRVISGHQDPALNLHCSEFEINNWLLSEFLIKKLVPIVGVHPYPITELNLMAAAVVRMKPQQIFEWGTNIGKSARVFHETAKRFKIELHVHSVDLPDDVEHGEHPRSNRGYMVRGLRNVSLYQADGLSKSIELYQKTPTLRTLVFIDGDHSYDSVFRELAGVIQAMPNASILLHDTFYQSEDSGYNIGPFRAINDVLAANPDKYKVLSTNTGLPGMTLLYPKQDETVK